LPEGVLEIMRSDLCLTDFLADTFPCAVVVLDMFPLAGEHIIRMDASHTFDNQTGNAMNWHISAK
jgi:hypothetical protein